MECAQERLYNIINLNLSLFVIRTWHEIILHTHMYIYNLKMLRQINNCRKVTKGRKHIYIERFSVII